MAAQYMRRKVERHLQSIHNCAQSDGIVFCPRIMIYFLHIYAISAAIHHAASSLLNICQHSQKENIMYYYHINDKANICDSVFDDIDKMTLFVNGLLQGIQTIVV